MRPNLLIGSGTQLRPFPNDMMAAGFKAAMSSTTSSAKNPGSEDLRQLAEIPRRPVAVVRRRREPFRQLQATPASPAARRNKAARAGSPGRPLARSCPMLHPASLKEKGVTMERRSFLKKAAVAAVPFAATAAAPPSPELPTIKGAVPQLPQEPRHQYGAADLVAKPGRRGHRWQVPDPGVRGGEIVPGPAVLGRRQPRHRSSAVTPAPYYYVGKGPHLRHRHPHPLRPQQPPADAWMMEGGGLELFREFFKDYNIHPSRAATPAPRWAAGSEGDQDRRRPQGPQVPRSAASGRGALAKLGVVPQQIPAATSTRPSKRHHRRCRVGRPMTTEARLQQSRQVLLLPGFLGRRPADPMYINIKRWNACPRNTDHPPKTPALRPRRNAGPLRRQNPALVELIAAGAQLPHSPTR